MDPKALIKHYETLKADRSTLETRWQEIAELMAPMRADFTTQRIEGQLRGLQVFDGAAMIAADNLASALWGSITNAQNDWFGLRHPDPEIGREGPVSDWLDDAADKMRGVFAANGMRFYGRVLDFYADLVKFGTAIFYVDEPSPGRVRFTNRPLVECVIAQDDEETVDTVYRCFEFTAKQAVDRWGDRAPAKAKKQLERNPHEKMKYLHAVMPNKARGYRALGPRDMPFASVHVCMDTHEVIQSGGFEEFPYQVARWGVLSRGLYGDSPAMTALADTKVLQAMVKTNLVASQKAADPPILAPDETAMRQVRVTPGGIIYGGTDLNGNQLVRPLESRGAFTLTDAMAEQKREAIRTAFYSSLLLMTARPNQTATEVLARQEEQLRLMGPHLGRVQSEFLDPLVRRVFMIMWRGGAFEDVPPEIVEAGTIRVEYVSPLARAQRAAEAQAVLRTLEAAGAMAQLKPDVLDVLDMDEMLRSVALAYGVKNAALVDPRRVMQGRQARAQAQAQQMADAQEMAAAAPMRDAAQAAKTMAEAEQIGGAA